MNMNTNGVIVAMQPKKAAEIVANAANSVEQLNAYASGVKWLVEKHAAKLSLCENTVELNNNLGYAIAMDTAGNGYNRVVSTLKARKLTTKDDMALSHFFCVIVQKCLPVKLAAKDVKSTKVVLDKETRFVHDKERDVASLLSFDVAVAEYQLTYGQLCSTSYVAGGVINLTLGNLHLVNKSTISWTIADSTWFSMVDDKPVVITIPAKVASQLVVKIKAGDVVRIITLKEKDDIGGERALKERKALMVSSKYHDFVVPSVSLLDVLPLKTGALPTSTGTLDLLSEGEQKTA